jgi:hypothetical protein
MARSTDDSDDRRKRRSKEDRGYEVLPDDDDEEDEGRPRRRVTRLDEYAHDRPRRPRRSRRSGHPARKVLGVSCAILAAWWGLVAVVGIIGGVTALVGGNWIGIWAILLMLAIPAAIARYYWFFASAIIRGESGDYDFSRCGLASLVLGGLFLLVWARRITRVMGGDHLSAQAVVEMLVGAGLIGLLLVVGVLSFVEAGVLQLPRRRNR